MVGATVQLVLHRHQPLPLRDLQMTPLPVAAALIALRSRHGPGIPGAAQAELVQDVPHVSLLCIHRLRIANYFLGK
jgi:hypothetical protein